MFYGEDGTTTGVSNDLKRVKQIASRMVRDYGMSHLGPIYYGSGGNNIFLGRELADGRKTNLSDNTMDQVDAAVSDIIKEALESATLLLEEKRNEIGKITEIAPIANSPIY